MKYVITNYTCIGSECFDSEPMDYEKALELFNTITRQAMRGMRPFPYLVDETGKIIR